MGIQAIELLKSCILNTSGANKFYCHLLANRDKRVKGTLLDRAQSHISMNNLNIADYVLNKSYRNNFIRRSKAKIPHGENGLIDSVRHLLSTSDRQSHAMLELLLKY